MVLDGEVYDVSEFVADHPGGRLITLAAGRQATSLFESYHLGASLPRARRVLARRARHLGGLVVSQREPAGDPAFFEAVRHRVSAVLADRGLDPHARRWMVGAEAIVVVGLFLLVWGLRLWFGSYLAAVAGGLLLGRLGFLMHSGNHAGVSRRSARNAAVGGLMDVIGGSSYVWQMEHQVAHHGKPNVYGHDNDCEIAAPVLRFHPAQPRRPWHRVQVVVLGVALSIGLVKWLVSDFVHLAQRRVGNVEFHTSRTIWCRIVALKALWVAMHVVIPIVVLGPLTGLATTVVMMAVGSYYTEGIFIVNHLQRGLVPPDDVHWAQQQVLGTCNWRGGSHWANVVSGGLNHQIEHHLFPGMSFHLYPTIAPVVRQTCEEFGLPYRNYRGFVPALLGTVSYLHQLGRAPKDCRVPDFPGGEAATGSPPG